MRQDDDLEEYFAWLRGHSVEFDTPTRVDRAPDHDGDLIPTGGPTRRIELEGIPAFDEHREAESIIAADHATFMVVDALRTGAVPVEGRVVWDVGCGTGVLTVVPALLGASEVKGSDVSADALECARRTAESAGVAAEFLHGSSLEPYPAGEQPDVVVANLPHKPCPPGGNLPVAQAGGPNGDTLHVGCAKQAAARLRPNGSMVFFLHSLPSPRVLSTYAEHFRLRPVAWKRRWFQREEYGSVQKYFDQRARAGIAYMPERNGRSFAIACTWVGTLT